MRKGVLALGLWEGSRCVASVVDLGEGVGGEEA